MVMQALMAEAFDGRMKRDQGLARGNGQGHGKRWNGACLSRGSAQGL